MASFREKNTGGKPSGGRRKRGGRKRPDRRLEQQIEACLNADRVRLRKRLERLRRGQGGEEALARLRAEIESSHERLAWRSAHRPAVDYPDDLPITAHRERIVELLRSHRALVVAGETGSGKTTQLPKMCLEAGFGADGMIGVTQPRRLAAVGMANRVAEELGSSLGEAVGYQIRFGGQTSPRNFIKFMTDGILLAETPGDRDLLAYDVVMIDEAHERSLNIDFLLGYLRRLLERRADLRVVVSSATLDVARVSAFFRHAPVVEVSGRTYPVAIRHRPSTDEDEDLPARVAETVRAIVTGDILDPDGGAPANGDDAGETDAVLDPESLETVDAESMAPAEADAAATAYLRRNPRGHVLVFLSGERPIRETLDALAGRHLPGVEVVPLFARLSAAEQSRVFQPTDKRRVILATNVAETSLTLPGVRYVIDAGVARIARYSYRTQVSRLQEERVSRASADQRKGRCGREAPGLCVRLYSPEDYADRSDFTDPEIRRASLANVILRMKALRLGDAGGFPFLDPPSPRMIHEGYTVLRELGAMTETRNLTPLGRKLAEIPVDPRIGRIILAGADEGALRESLVLAAVLSLRDPRERPLDKQEAADQAHRKFFHEKSDFLGWMALWKEFGQVRREAGSNNQIRRWCKQHFLNFSRMREWRELQHQLAEQAHGLGLRRNARPASYRQIHRALLAGFLGRIGLLDRDGDKGSSLEKGEYQGTRGLRFVLWPGSALRGRNPRCVVAAELVETTRRFARTVAEIRPDWVESVAGDLVEKSYRDPHWDGAKGFARAHERVSLFGVPLMERRVHYGPIDPAKSRELLITDGLVRGDLRTEAPFFIHNHALVGELRDLEQKTRRRDLLVDEEDLIAFYNGRIPYGIVTGRDFERWRRDAVKRDPSLLFMTREDLLLNPPPAVEEEDFPNTLIVGDLRLPLSYRFESGAPEDGVTADVPVEVLNHLEGWCFEWLVPGLLPDKIAWMLKALPKSLRKRFVPVPDTARELAKTLLPDGPLLPKLARALWKIGGEKIDEALLADIELPPHLRMNLRVVNEKGDVLRMGRDLGALRGDLEREMKSSFANLPKDRWERERITAWEFGRLEEREKLEVAGRVCFAYPALVDGKDHVKLRLFDTEEEARRVGRDGMRRLMALTLQPQIKLLKKGLPVTEAMRMRYAAFGGAGSGLGDEVLLAALEQVFLGPRPWPREKPEFDNRLKEGRTEFARIAFELAKTLDPILGEAQATAALLDDTEHPWQEAASRDIFEQISHLVYPGFVTETPPDRFAHFPRYFAAIRERLARLRHGASKDRQRMETFAPYWQRYLDAAPATLLFSPAWEELSAYRWMLEEWRVSLHAQKLGTDGKISAKRLDEQWAAFEAAGGARPKA